MSPLWKNILSLTVLQFPPNSNSPALPQIKKAITATGSCFLPSSLPLGEAHPLVPITGCSEHLTRAVAPKPFHRSREKKLSTHQHWISDDVCHIIELYLHLLLGQITARQAGRVPLLASAWHLAPAAATALGVMASFFSAPNMIP